MVIHKIQINFMFLLGGECMEFNMLLVISLLFAVIIFFIHMKYTKELNKADINNAKMETIISNMDDGIIIMDENDNITYVNPAIEKALGCKSEEIINRHLQEIFTEVNVRMYHNYHCCKCKEICDEDVLNGELKCSRIKSETIKNKNGKIFGKVIILPDMVECDEAHQLIHKMAHYDMLTGIANRALINENLREMIKDAKMYNTKIAVVFIDLDNFKLINDSMGHDTGDLVLRTVAEVIQNSLDIDDVAGRFGGDEFIVLMPNISDEKEALYKTNRIAEHLNQCIRINNKEVHMPASMGIAIYPKDGTTVEELVKNADIAMYGAKNLGKNTCKLYNSEIDMKILEEQKLTHDLKEAIKNKEFMLYYQPKINIINNEVIGMEALIRWNKPNKGIIYPLDFIPLAEEKGLIIPIGKWVLMEACRQNKKWQDLGYKPLRVSVNISIVQLLHEGLVDIVKEALIKTGLDPKWLELEITESAAMKSFDTAVKRIKELKKLGIYISLDDFGTGYSSYNYLSQLPVDAIKIDRVFLEDLKKDSDQEFITKTMIALAKKMDMIVIAEGVETPNQLNFLKQQKCHIAQGFLFSRPVPPSEFESFVKNFIFAN